MIDISRPSRQDDENIILSGRDKSNKDMVWELNQEADFICAEFAKKCWGISHWKDFGKSYDTDVYVHVWRDVSGDMAIGDPDRERYILISYEDWESVKTWMAREFGVTRRSETP